MTMSGVTQSFAGLLVTRFLIGVFEVKTAILRSPEDNANNVKVGLFPRCDVARFSVVPSSENADQDGLFLSGQRSIWSIFWSFGRGPGSVRLRTLCYMVREC